jgi:hypothetical protein
MMDPSKCPTGDASSDGWPMRCRMMWVGSSSGGRHGRRLPLTVTAEPVQSLDAMLAVVAETEVERLRRYLEVS